MGSEGLPLSRRKTGNLFFRQLWQLGTGGGVLKISWEFEILCEMSYLEMFSLERMRKQHGGTEQSSFTGPVPQLPTDNANHLISQPTKQP